MSRRFSYRSMQAIRLYQIVALVLLSVSGALPADETVIALTTNGGEAWTFDKHIEGRLAQSKCDAVSLESPAGSVRARITDGEFVGEVPLQPGPNRIEAVCLSAGTEVARSAPQHWQLRLPDTPRAWIRTRVTGKSISLDAGRTEAAPGSPAPMVRYEWRTRPHNPAPLTSVENSEPLDTRPAEGERIELQAPKVDGEYYVTLRATDAMGRSDESTTVFRVVNGEPQEIDLANEHPKWVDNAVLYGVAPFFFGQHGYQNVQQRLDAIAALGVTAIWLSPVTRAATDDFGYAVTDHFNLRDTFGPEPEFRALVEAAHARGLRVLMDFVPNHFSNEHRYYTDAARNGRRSAYFQWFERDEDGEPTHYFDWKNLKNLDYDNPEVQNHIIAAFAHWVREYGIDGFRVDASWAIRERAPEFWPRWRAELKRIDPDVFLLAEASARDGYYVQNGFDAAYDWTYNLGQWAWNDVFTKTGPDLNRLRTALTNNGTGYPPDTLILRFLNNNDTGARFITRYGIDQTRVAATMLLTLPGLPLIYNGDEVGAAFEPYAEGPPIVWRDKHRLSAHYGKLASLRHQLSALRSRTLELVHTDHDDSVLAYLRPGVEAESSILVLLNFGAKPVDAKITPTDGLRAFAGSGVLEDVLTGNTLSIEPSAPVIHVPAYGARVLTFKPRKRSGP